MKNCWEGIRMKYKIFILFVFSVMSFSPFGNVHAAECTGSYQTVSNNISVEPRDDIIVTKFRILNDVIQYRRWNETKGVWVDDDWITDNV